MRESMTSLLGEIGLTDGGDNIRAIKACLLRMTNVTVMVTKGLKHKSFHLMSHDFDEEDGRLSGRARRATRPPLSSRCRHSAETTLQGPIRPLPILMMK